MATATDMKSIDEIHEQQINELFKAVPQEERQRILSKFQSKKSQYLTNLKQLQQEVNAYLKQQALNNNNNNNKKNSNNTQHLLQSLKQKQLTNEELDFDAVMADFIESEYNEEDHFFVTSDDPMVQKVVGDSGIYGEELDEATLERIAGGDAMEVERIKKRLEQEKEENADQRYEFDNPMRLTKKQALEIFTGKRKIARQFEYVKTGLKSTIERGLSTLTGAIGQEHLDEQFYQKVDRKTVQQVVEQLKQYEDKRINDQLPSTESTTTAADKKKKNQQQQKKKTKLLFSPSYEVVMLVNMQQASLVNIAPFTIPLKNALYDAEDVNICIIVRDNQKDAYKQLIADEPYAASTKVMTIKKLMTQYKPYDKREFLRKSYDLFYVEKEVNSMMPSLLGKSFYKKSKKGPQPMTAENLKTYIQQDIQGTRLFLAQGSDQYVVRVGKLDDTAQQVTDNVLAALQHVPRHVPNGGSLNITKILLKTAASPSVPIYYNPDVKVKSVDEIKQFTQEQKWRQTKPTTTAAVEKKQQPKAAEPVATPKKVETPKKAAETPKKVETPKADKPVSTPKSTTASAKKRAHPSGKESASKKRKN